ncbi:hypothetical protein AB6M97_00260 [Streptococcus hillyeri]|uniref:DUF4435 domain-containing protein n=1 Tax=Streptococcus hillyeri TaxID=2282420 RepID=A0A3L9DRN0_9STRE|nr:hypothetical protein [Streptococcus hillyeri]RLY02663.1 hypothetical protein EAF07_07085 [Streptococcus hillyeri]
MLDIESDESLETYDEFLEEVSSKPFCFVEGNNKFFYQQIKELYPYVVDNGGNCIDIIEKVEHDKDKVGIIDNDYRDKTKHFDNIVKIDYYSIENIALQKVPEFTCLKNELKKNQLEELKIHDIKVNFFPQEIENANFELLLGRKYTEDTRINYVQGTITSVDSLIKYKNLKVAVEGTSRYLKMKFQKNIQYINDLHNYINDKSLKEILSKDEYNRFLVIDKSVRKQV